jgi:hypothetical protein
MNIVDKRMVRLFACAFSLAVLLSFCGCSQSKDQGGNGTGVYYTGPMKSKGAKQPGGKTGGE